MKVLFSNILKNGHIVSFDQQTQKLESHCITKETAPHESSDQKVYFQRMVAPRD